MIDFEIPEPSTYPTRKNKSIFIVVAVIGTLLLFFLGGDYNIVIIFIILILLFFIQSHQSIKSEQYFITHIKIQNGNVDVTYKDREQLSMITGTLDSMVIRKENATLSRNKTTYLAIYDNQKLLLRQFIRGAWTEEKFDAIEQDIRKFKIMGREIG